MKKIYLAACAAMMTFTVNAENVENEINSTSEAQASENYDAENGVVTIGSDRMFQIESKDGKFSFKPYLMIQSTANFHYYDDEGLDKAYNQDNVANSGFAMPYAVLGFTGKAFSNITYNLSINAAASGANILQQAWFDVKVSDGFAERWVSSRLLSQVHTSQHLARLLCHVFLHHLLQPQLCHIHLTQYVRR